MVHSTNVLMFGLSTNNKKKDGFLRLIVFTIVKITSTDKEIYHFIESDLICEMTYVNSHNVKQIYEVTYVNSTMID
jgi:hypothetical protein